MTIGHSSVNEASRFKAIHKLHGDVEAAFQRHKLPEMVYMYYAVHLRSISLHHFTMDMRRQLAPASQHMEVDWKPCIYPFVRFNTKNYLLYKNGQPASLNYWYTIPFYTFLIHHAL